MLAILAQIPEDIVKEYRHDLVDGQGTDIDEETKKLDKRYKHPVKRSCRPESLMQEPASSKVNPRVLEKISRNLKMV